MAALAKLGRTLRLPFVTVGLAYNAKALKHPFWTGVVTTVVKTSAADCFAQKASDPHALPLGCGGDVGLCMNVAL